MFYCHHKLLLQFQKHNHLVLKHLMLGADLMFPPVHKYLYAKNSENVFVVAILKHFLQNIYLITTFQTTGAPRSQNFCFVIFPTSQKLLLHIHNSNILLLLFISYFYKLFLQTIAVLTKPQTCSARMHCSVC